MRFIALASIALLVAIGGLVACNSSETLLSQTPATSTSPQQQTSPPNDGARRITAADLHKLWEKGDVLIIDTRAESAAYCT
jgi:hypothetical protein